VLVQRESEKRPGSPGWNGTSNRVNRFVGFRPSPGCRGAVSCRERTHPSRNLNIGAAQLLFGGPNASALMVLSIRLLTNHAESDRARAHTGRILYQQQQSALAALSRRASKDNSFRSREKVTPLETFFCEAHRRILGVRYSAPVSELEGMMPNSLPNSRLRQHHPTLAAWISIVYEQSSW
jgi:hypothetical protein